MTATPTFFFNLPGHLSNPSACLWCLQCEGCVSPCVQAEQHKTSELRKVLMLAIPTFFDLVATILMNIGLLSVTASVYQV